jgi:hypothetical protein
VGQVNDRTQKAENLSAERQAQEKDQLLGILMKYQIEGRYPYSAASIPTSETVKTYYQHTSKILTWLKGKF